MTLQEVTEHLQKRATERPILQAKVLFCLGKNQYLHIDGTKKNTISNQNQAADCTITISLSDFVLLMTGKLNPTMAFWSGKMQISGSYMVALKMQDLFL